MSLYGDMNNKNLNDELVWKALSDKTRRQILDLLAKEAQYSGEIIEQFPKLCRTAVMKHLDILEAAELIRTERIGRRRLNHLEIMPIQQIYERFVKPILRVPSARLTRLKAHLETNQKIEERDNDHQED